MHAKPDLRVFLKWKIAGSGSVITDVIRLTHMTLDEFQIHVAAHFEVYRGEHPHSPEEFAAFEATLGSPVPMSIRWLLGTHGYSDATGIDNLSESVENTLRLRNSLGLPNEWLLLNDWGDAGVVLLNLNSERICWCGIHNASRLATGDDLDEDVDWFSNYAEWSVSRFEIATNGG